MSARSRLWLVLAFAAGWSAQARAQKGFSDCNAPRELRLASGEQLKVNCDYAFVLNPQAYALLSDQRDNIARLKLLLEDNRKDRDALLSQQQQLVSELEQLNQVQDHYYAELKKYHDVVDQAAMESARNTRTALHLAQGARVSSYLTAGIIGGLGGGLGGSQVGNRGGLEIGVGVVLGSVVGLGINWALLHFIGAQ
jgi:hypothetical protein